MSLRPKTITIAGGGPVGALLSIFLARRGYDVTIFESRPDLRKHSISAGRSINLALAHRGIRPLHLAGLMSRLEPTLLPMRGRMLHDEQGAESLLLYGQRSHELIYSVSRGGLNQLLLDAAEATGKVTIQFQQQVESIKVLENRARVRDGQTGIISEHAYELLLGADGAGSAVRRALDIHFDTPSLEEKLFHSYKELHIPPGPGGTFQLDKAALHIWPRGDGMLIALPNADGSFTATLFLPDRGAASFQSLSSREAVLELFQRDFADALRLMPDAPEVFFRNPTGTLTTVHCPNWGLEGHALLIGDAAHAIVPFHGQGMNCGFEDCAELDRLLEAHHDDWGPVFAEYEAIRKPNAEAIALMAQENYVEMRSTVREPKFRLKKEISFELERRCPDRFIPRYSMVMFHHLPYRDALERGRVQEAFLDRLAAEIETSDQVDFVAAERWVDENLSRLPVEN